MGGPVRTRGAMGYGSGVGVGGGGLAKSVAAPAPVRAEPSAAPTPSLAPPPASPRQDASGRPAQGSDDGRAKRREHVAADEEGERQQPAASGFVVTAGGSTGVAATAPLVEAVRAALAGDRGASRAGVGGRWQRASSCVSPSTLAAASCASS